MKKTFLRIISSIIFICFIPTNLSACGDSNEIKADDESEQVDIIDEKEEFDGYDKYEKNELRVGDFVFSIPEYWVEGNTVKEDDYEEYQLYAETDGKVAMFQIRLSYDDVDEVSYELLVKDEPNMIAYLKKLFKGNAEWYKHFTNSNGLSGEMYKYDGKVNIDLFTVYDAYGYETVFPSYEDNCWLYVDLVHSGNTKYSYYNDYMKILDNIRFEPKEETNITESEKVEKTTEPEQVKEEEKPEEITQDSDLFQNMLKMDYDELYEFSKEYRNVTIKFDGSVDYHQNHGKYKTRFDLLLSYGDYDENKQIGPTFRFRNVNSSDLVGNETFYYGLPYYTETGDNVKVTAKIIGFNPDTGIFELDPILVEAR